MLCLRRWASYRLKHANVGCFVGNVLLTRNTLCRLSNSKPAPTAHHIQTLRHRALCRIRHRTRVHLRLIVTPVSELGGRAAHLRSAARGLYDIPRIRERSLVPKLSRLPVQRHGTNYCRQYVTFRQQPLLNAIWKLIFIIVPLLKFSYCILFHLISYSSGQFIFAVSFFCYPF